MLAVVSIRRNRSAVEANTFVTVFEEPLTEVPGQVAADEPDLPTLFAQGVGEGEASHDVPDANLWGRVHTERDRSVAKTHR